MSQVHTSAPSPCAACPWRTANHGRAALDRLWKGPSRTMSRTAAYAGMRFTLGLDDTTGHIGAMGISECERLIAAVDAYFGTPPAAPVEIKPNPGATVALGRFVLDEEDI